jgi:Ni,Fe-hydrogenase III small subunit
MTGEVGWRGPWTSGAAASSAGRCGCSVARKLCNGCESELVALGGVVFDLARFGVQFVASPRHADGIVIRRPSAPT